MKAVYMNNITVRNISDRIHKQLKKRSELSRRSINSEIIACLEEALFTNKSEVEQILRKSQEIRNNQNFEITLSELEEAKNYGRI
jgi:plasmid stability protein